MEGFQEYGMLLAIKNRYLQRGGHRRAYWIRRKWDFLFKPKEGKKKSTLNMETSRKMGIVEGGMKKRKV